MLYFEKPPEKRNAMLIKKKRPWEIPENEATPEAAYMNRRGFLKKTGAYIGAAGMLMAGLNTDASALFEKDDRIIKVPGSPTSHLYPARKNIIYKLDRPITSELVAGRYNNFYEFSSDKNVWMHIKKMRLRPWTLEITGLVERPRVYDIDDLVRKMALEERLYRLRCVEAWAMAVPWTGFPMKELLRLARPLSSARYVMMRTFYEPEWASQQKFRFWLPWPYEEGLTMEEASNELTLLATGIYGHELPRQHGAPIRLIVPWKYGFKSVKSIVRIEFVERRPRTFWNTLVPQEYDFWANVDPKVPHPRWSQETERIIGTQTRLPTMKFNGYGEYVAGLYRQG